MRIATFNINGINGRLPVLLKWLKETSPDVVCLQELKAPDERFPEAALKRLVIMPSGMGKKLGTVWLSFPKKRFRKLEEVCQVILKTSTAGILRQSHIKR
ncbi:endonuclease/exonuclease/phosphatase family protein [Pedobacter panaciterrae]